LISEGWSVGMTKGLMSFFFNTPILSPNRRLYEPEATTPVLQGPDFQELWTTFKLPHLLILVPFFHNLGRVFAKKKPVNMV
jgi:hypothetical protein